MLKGDLVNQIERNVDYSGEKIIQGQRRVASALDVHQTNIKVCIFITVLKLKMFVFLLFVFFLACLLFACRLALWSTASESAAVLAWRLL